MKKLLIGASLIIMGLFSHAQDTTKLTVAKVYNDVKSGFSTLVEKLQGPAKYTFEIYVKQQFTAGLTGLISGLLFALISGFIFKFFVTKCIKEEGDIDGWATGAIVFGLIFILTLIDFVLGFSDNLQHVINPTYFAIQDVIKAFK